MIRLLSALLRRVKQPPEIFIEPKIVGQEFLDSFHDHYDEFQRLFLLEYRKNSDEVFWGSRTLKDISHVSPWSDTKGYVVNPAAKIRWWTINDGGDAEDEIRSYPPHSRT